MLHFGVIGYPVAHSFSPQVHGAAFKAAGIDAVSEKIEVRPEDLADFMEKFRKKFSGVNVTIPHKENIMAFLDEIDGEAKKIGAVNTIVNRDGKLIGCNTDSHGAMMALFEGIAKNELGKGSVTRGKPEAFRGEFLSGKKIVVLGAGGASRAVCFGVLKNGGELTILNRHVERAREIANDFAGFFPDRKVIVGNISDFDARNCDILINTTSCGMAPDENETPLPDLKAKLQNTELRPLVMDIVYRPRETKFIREAKSAGCKIITGERMFLHQAARGFELWTGQKAPFEAMEKALYKALGLH